MVQTLACDTFVYGSTPGGIAAAVQAARQGDRVILACPKRNPGGMAASGLCTTDAVRRHLFGGLVIELIDRVRDHYLQTLGRAHPDFALCQDGWHYEPSVAERVFRDLLEAQPGLDWLPGRWLIDVTTDGREVERVALVDGNDQPTHIAARTFIDATYEGDLAAHAGVGYRVGREGRDEFGESLAGIHYMNWRTGRTIDTPHTGEASIAIQSYCARCIVTDDPSIALPIDRPARYDQHLQDYLPLLQDFKTGRVKHIRDIFPLCPLPNRKIEINGFIEGNTSFNCPGINWGYPEADRHTRADLDRFHIEHAQGLIYFLAHEKGVPDDIAAAAGALGLHPDEFAEHGHWPWQIYVRQGRRIDGRAMVTQHSFTVDKATGTTPRVDDAVALGEHSFDIHPCHDRRFTVDGFMEGVLWYPQKADGPAQPGQLPYGIMLPRDLDNLLVPVAMSATHVAFSVLRMEPLWMTTGQIAGRAAALAREQGVAVADIDPAALRGGG